MASTLIKDMTVDPVATYLGTGALRYPWVVNEIAVNNLRNEFSRAYWVMEPIIETTDFNFMFKLTDQNNVAINSSYLKVGMFNSLAPTNETDRIGVEIYNDNVGGQCNIFIRGHTTAGAQFSFGPLTHLDTSPIMLAEMLALKARYEFTYVAKVATLTVYNDLTSAVIGTGTYTVTTQTFSCDSFGMGNRSGTYIPLPTPNFTGDFHYFEAYPAPDPPIVKRGYRNKFGGPRLYGGR